MKYFILLLMSICMLSCTKKGDPGTQGPAGTNGNANVTAYHFSIAPQDWTTQGTAGINSIKSVKLPFAELDSTMLESGSVNVYFFENNYYQNLPVNWSYIGSTTIYFNYQYTLDTLLIHAHFSNYSGSGFPQNFYFKTVFVKGN